MTCRKNDVRNVSKTFLIESKEECYIMQEKNDIERQKSNKDSLIEASEVWKDKAIKKLVQYKLYVRRWMRKRTKIKT